MNRHLLKIGTRVLNDAVLADKALPAEDVMTFAFEGYVWSECRNLILLVVPGDPHPSAKTRQAYLDPDRIEKVCADAARHLMSGWTPHWIKKQQAYGRRGGLLRKDAPTYSDTQLDRLAELAHLTVPAQSVELGVSMSTIDRMRSALRGRDAADFAELVGGDPGFVLSTH